jgi:predicted secreted protein
MKTVTAMAAMLAMVLCVGVARADEKPAKPAGDKKPMAARVAGEISAIEANKSITVKTPKKGEKEATETVVTITAETPVKEGTEKKTVADLKVGQKVNVTLEGDTKNAKSIAIQVKKEGGEGHK